MPAIRPASLIGGCPDCSEVLVRAGGDVGAGSGVIETVYSRDRRKTMPGGPAEGVLVFPKEIGADMADAVFDVLAGLLLGGHQPDSCHQKNNRYLGCSLHDQIPYHSREAIADILWARHSVWRFEP
jgi:hypothetical protein